MINWWDTTLDGLLIKYGYGGKQESVSIDTIPSGGAYRITIPQRLEDNSWISLDVTHVPSLEKFYGGKIQVDGEMVRVGRKEDEYWMKAINIDNHTEVRLGFFEFEPWRWRDSTLLIMYSENLMRPDEQISFESLENRNGVLVATLDKKLEETQQLSVEIVDYSTNGDPVLTVNGPPVRERVWRFICGTGAMIAWEQRMMGATFLSIFVSIMLAIFMLLLGILLRPSSRLG